MAKNLFPLSDKSLLSYGLTHFACVLLKNVYETNASVLKDKQLIIKNYLNKQISKLPLSHKSPKNHTVNQQSIKNNLTNQHKDNIKHCA